MITFKKAHRYLALYLSGLIFLLAMLSLWIVLLVKNPGSKVGDIVLLAILFAILLGGSGIFIGLYLYRPATVLALDDENVYVYLSKKKTVTYPFSDISSFGKIRHNLVIVTKSGEMRIVRFLVNGRETELALKTGLNAFITKYPDRYFTNNLLKEDQKSKEGAEISKNIEK